MLITPGLNFALRFHFNKVTEVWDENISDICPSYMFPETIAFSGLSSRSRQYARYIGYISYTFLHLKKNLN